MPSLSFYTYVVYHAILFKKDNQLLYCRNLVNLGKELKIFLEKKCVKETYSRIRGFVFRQKS